MQGSLFLVFMFLKVVKFISIYFEYSKNALKNLLTKVPFAAQALYNITIYCSFTLKVFIPLGYFVVRRILFAHVNCAPANSKSKICFVVWYYNIY